MQDGLTCRLNQSINQSRLQVTKKMLSNKCQKGALKFLSRH